MSIPTLADSANLYDNYQILFGLQMDLEASISRLQKRIADTITAMQANPQFPNTSPAEQQYMADMITAAQAASAAVAVPVNPDLKPNR